MIIMPQIGFSSLVPLNSVTQASDPGGPLPSAPRFLSLSQGPVHCTACVLVPWVPPCPHSPTSPSFLSLLPGTGCQRDPPNNCLLQVQYSLNLPKNMMPKKRRIGHLYLYILLATLPDFQPPFILYFFKKTVASGIWGTENVTQCCFQVHSRISS